jgi:hypothetical protein
MSFSILLLLALILTAYTLHLICLLFLHCQKDSVGMSKQHLKCNSSLCDLFGLRGRKSYRGAMGSCLFPASSLTGPTETSSTSASHKGCIAGSSPGTSGILPGWSPLVLLMAKSCSACGAFPWLVCTGLLT